MAVEVAFSYPDTAEDFAIPRYLIAALTVSWYHQAIEVCGQSLTLNVGGVSGFHAYIHIPDWVWSFSGKTVRAAQMFDDFRLTYPGGAPITGITVALRWGFPVQRPYPIVAAIIPGYDGAVSSWLTLPKAPPSYRQTAWDTGYPGCFDTTP
jgi:hypothetical protein